MHTGSLSARHRPSEWAAPCERATFSCENLRDPGFSARWFTVRPSDPWKARLRILAETHVQPRKGSLAVEGQLQKYHC